MADSNSSTPFGGVTCYSVLASFSSACSAGELSCNLHNGSPYVEGTSAASSENSSGE